MMKFIDWINADVSVMKSTEYLTAEQLGHLLARLSAVYCKLNKQCTLLSPPFTFFLYAGNILRIQLSNVEYKNLINLAGMLEIHIY